MYFKIKAYLETWHISNAEAQLAWCGLFFGLLVILIADSSYSLEVIGFLFLPLLFAFLSLIFLLARPVVIAGTSYALITFICLLNLYDFKNELFYFFYYLSAFPLVFMSGLIARYKFADRSKYGLTFTFWKTYFLVASTLGAMPILFYIYWVNREFLFG